jgi:hypothetical protein
MGIKQTTRKLNGSKKTNMLNWGKPLGIELVYDSTKASEYKGAHSIGCKN